MVRHAATILGTLVVLLMACGDDEPVAPGGATSSGSSGSSGTPNTAVTCEATPAGVDFCRCEPKAASAPANDTPCDVTTSIHGACCKESGSSACACRQYSCSEQPDGSCRCGPGADESDRFVEACSVPEDGHCCRSADSCSCGDDECPSPDDEVDSCNPADLVEFACGSGEAAVTDCRAN